MTAHRKECSATLSGSLMPATHHPLRLIFFNRPVSAKKFTALAWAGLFFLALFFLFCDFIAKYRSGMGDIERQRVAGHRDGKLRVQALKGDLPDPLLLGPDDQGQR